jgi:hypothetical protein
MKTNAIVIPKKFQKQIIGIAHESHQGISSTLGLQKHKVWFYGMSTMVKEQIETCDACQMSTNQPIKPQVILTEMPIGPWSHIEMDFYGPLQEDGKHIVVITDLYSRYVEFEIIQSVAGETVIAVLTTIFRRFGLPNIIKSDNGALFNSKAFDHFCSKYNIIHKPVTPYWPRANGAVERLMQTLTKCRRVANVNGINYKEQIETNIASYRNTVHPTTNKTPSSLIFVHDTNTS